MLPPSLIPDNANELLIVNQDVWEEEHYFRIVFSDPSILRLVLTNQISYAHNSSAVQCYHLPPGQYYTVITDRYSYQGSSLSITSSGIGIRDCYNNNVNIYSGLQEIAEKIDSSYQKDYTKPDLYPV